MIRKVFISWVGLLSVLNLSIAQAEKDQALRAVMESVSEQTTIQASQKRIGKQVKKLTKRYDSARFKDLLKDLVDLNEVGSVNSVAYPSELFKLKKRFELTKSEIKQLKRLEHQLTAAKDEWHHYASKWRRAQAIFGQSEI